MYSVLRPTPDFLFWDGCGRADFVLPPQNRILVYKLEPKTGVLRTTPPRKLIHENIRVFLDSWTWEHMCTFQASFSDSGDSDLKILHFAHICVFSILFLKPKSRKAYTRNPLTHPEKLIHETHMTPPRKLIHVTAYTRESTVRLLYRLQWH